jgi:succinoglycan biosynthesis transport protein ExoP
MNQRQITLHDIWQIIWKRKFWLVLPLVLVTAVAFGGSYLLPTVYSSSTKIVISSTKLVSRELQSMIPTELADLPNERTAQRWLASTRSEILSSSYISRLITDLKLGPKEKIIKAAGQMQNQFPQYALQDIVRKLQIDELRDNIGVGMIGDNQVVITCTSDQPKLAVDMATKLAEVYRERKLSDEVVTSRESRAFTDQQLAFAKKAFEDAEKALADFKTTYISANLQAGISSQTNVSAIQSELDATNLEMREAIDRKNFLATRLTEVGIDTLSALQLAKDLAGDVDDALASTKEISHLMMRYLWKDAKIQMQLTKVSDAFNSMQSRSAALAKQLYPDRSVSLQSDLGELIYRRYQIGFLEGKDQILRTSVQQIRGIVAGTPYYDQMVESLQKNVDSKRSIYDKWQSQSTGVSIQQATTQAEAETKYQILEPATIPLEPSSPNRLKITLMGLGLGILLGVCAMILAEVVDHSIKNIEDIEELLGLEVVGTIPRIEDETTVKKTAGIRG